jgi:hypothetical protein
MGPEISNFFKIYPIPPQAKMIDVEVKPKQIIGLQLDLPSDKLTYSTIFFKKCKIYTLKR